MYTHQRVVVIPVQSSCWNICEPIFESLGELSTFTVNSQIHGQHVNIPHVHLMD